MHWQCRCSRLLPSCTGSADVTNCFHHAAHAHPDDWKRSSTRCLLSHYSVKDWNAPEGQFPTRPAESKSAYWQNSPPQRSDNVLRSSGRRGARSGRLQQEEGGEVRGPAISSCCPQGGGTEGHQGGSTHYCWGVTVHITSKAYCFVHFSVSELASPSPSPSLPAVTHIPLMVKLSLTPAEPTEHGTPRLVNLTTGLAVEGEGFGDTS